MTQPLHRAVDRMRVPPSSAFLAVRLLGAWRPASSGARQEVPGPRPCSELTPIPPSLLSTQRGLSPALFPGTEAGATGSWWAHRGPQLGDTVPGAPLPGRDQGPLSSTCPPTVVRDTRACLPGPPAAPGGHRHGGPLPPAPSGASERRPQGGGLAHKQVMAALSAASRFNCATVILRWSCRRQTCRRHEVYLCCGLFMRLLKLPA